jgi:transposase
LQWVDASIEYGSHKPLHNRFRRWSENGVFKRSLAELAKPKGENGDVLMIDATHLKGHRTASSLKKGRQLLAQTRPASCGLLMSASG